MRKRREKAFLSAALASLIGGSLAAQVNSTAANAHGPEEGQVQCYGVNQCKGMGACGTMAHSCAGKNACKGQAWVSMDKDACLKIKGGSLSPISKSKKPVKKVQKKKS